MKLLVFLSVILAAVSADFRSLKLEDWTYREGDKFFYFPGGDGHIYRVEVEEELDRSAAGNHSLSGKSVDYWLYTRLNPKDKQVLKVEDTKSVNQSYFNPNKITVFISHGWWSNGSSEINLLLKKAFLNDADVNVIVLDWGEVAKRNYISAKFAVIDIGTKLGLFIDWLRRDFHLSLEKVHLVGHSLGAHLVGNAGKTLNGGVKRITALDPAGPLWHYDHKHRVSSADARYVEVIHTNSFQCGYPFPSGHADHYPNGGKAMPGCRSSDMFCNHARSWRYMAASIEQNLFRAHKCNNVDEALNNKCVGDVGMMGNSDINKEQYGLYRVNTKEDYPYTAIQPTKHKIFMFYSRT